MSQGHAPDKAGAGISGPGRAPGGVQRRGDGVESAGPTAGRPPVGAVERGPGGLSPGKLQELTCSESRMMVGNYYPYCPQPDLTVGLTSHTDPGVITVLLQDQVGGLHVKHSDEWVDVTPVPGALVVNIGDILQIMSNDEYKSVDHRVSANPSQEPRVSIAVFCNPSYQENQFGPFPELVSLDKPAAFRQFTFSEHMTRFFTKELDGKSVMLKSIRFFP